MSVCSGATIGDRIREWRETRGLTLDQAGESIGVNASTWWRIEAGETRDPAPETSRRIASLLGVTLDDLFHIANGTEPPKARQDVAGSGQEVDRPTTAGPGSDRKSQEVPKNTKPHTPARERAKRAGSR